MHTYCMLLRLKSPKMTVGKLDTKEGPCSSRSKASRLKTQEEPIFSSTPKAGKKPTSQLKAVRQDEFPSMHGKVSLFVLFRPPTDWMRPTHIRKGNMLYSVY